MNARQIIKQVAGAHGMSMAEMLGPCPSPPFYRARRKAARRIRIERNLSTGQIAAYLNRDRSTVYLYLKPSRAATKRRQMREYKQRGRGQ